MPIKWDARADRKLFLLILKVHQIKLDYKTMAKEFGEDVTPSSLQQHLRKIMNSTPSDDTVPDRLASVTPDNGANSGGEESKKKPAKRPRVKATNGGAKRGRKRKAESAACTPTQEKERDLGEDGTAMESEDGNTHDFVGELEVDDE